MQCNQLTSPCASHSYLSQVMYMPLAEAITQLSFLEFLQRCGVPIAPPQPSQLPVPISLFWMPLCRRLHLVTPLRMCPRRRLFNRTRFRVMWLFRRLSTVSTSHPLDAAVQTTPRSTLSQHVSTQMGSRSASSFSVDISVQTPIRCVVLHDALPHNYRSRFSSLAASYSNRSFGPPKLCSSIPVISTR